VRIRRGVYKGDLAQVVDMNEDRSTNTATVKLVPRLDLNGFREKKLGTKETGSGKKKKAATRVAPRFFSEEEMKKQGFQQYLSRAAGGFITFDNQRFKDGYTHRVMNLNLLVPPPAWLVGILTLFSIRKRKTSTRRWTSSPSSRAASPTRTVRTRTVAQVRIIFVPMTTP